MGRGFSGEVTEFYHRYRRGYPPAVLDALAAEFALAGDDVVLDLGCGTGQLTRWPHGSGRQSAWTPRRTC